MEATGFARVTVELEHLRFEQDLCVWLAAVRRRDSNSQLMTEAGIRRLQREVIGGNAPQVRADHLCLLTVCGDRGRDG
jgi:hypothetical protein